MKNSDISGVNNADEAGSAGERRKTNVDICSCLLMVRDGRLRM
jgi:hypothetical protein